MELKIRSETPGDYSSISRINSQAFGRQNEADLVQALRTLAEFDPNLSLLAEIESQLVGHILLFPVHIRMQESKHLTVSLGPVAVLPEFQRQAIGTRLIEKGHEKAHKLGFDSVVLLGHPDYYPRFGYLPASNWGLTNPWNITGAAFMAIELVKGSLKGKPGLIEYPAAFDQAA